MMNCIEHCKSTNSPGYFLSFLTLRWLQMSTPEVRIESGAKKRHDIVNRTSVDIIKVYK